MFSFAMTSGLASDSDKFKIIITLCRVQKFGDTGPNKNLIFQIKLITDTKLFKKKLKTSFQSGLFYNIPMIVSG